MPHFCTDRHICGDSWRDRNWVEYLLLNFSLKIWCVGFCYFGHISPLRQAGDQCRLDPSKRPASILFSGVYWRRCAKKVVTARGHAGITPHRTAIPWNISMDPFRWVGRVAGFRLLVPCAHQRDPLTKNRTLPKHAANINIRAQKTGSIAA